MQRENRDGTGGIDLRDLRRHRGGLLKPPTAAAVTSRPSPASSTPAHALPTTALPTTALPTTVLPTRVIAEHPALGAGLPLLTGFGYVWSASTEGLIRFTTRGKARKVLDTPVRDIAISARAVVVLLDRAPELLSFDPTTLRTARRWRLPGPGGSVTTDGTIVYAVEGSAPARITRVDLSTGAMTTRVLPFSDTPAADRSIALGAGWLWFADQSAVAQLDPRTLATVRTIASPISPSSIWFGDSAVWVSSDSPDGGIFRLDPTTAKITTTEVRTPSKSPSRRSGCGWPPPQARRLYCRRQGNSSAASPPRTFSTTAAPASRSSARSLGGLREPGHRPSSPRLGGRPYLPRRLRLHRCASAVCLARKETLLDVASDFDAWIESLHLDDPDEGGDVGTLPTGALEFFREVFDAAGGPVSTTALGVAWKNRELALATHAVALVTADLRRTTELNPSIGVRNLDDDVTAVTYNGDCPTPALFAIRDPEATCEVADNLRDHIFGGLVGPPGRRAPSTAPFSTRGPWTDRRFGNAARKPMQPVLSGHFPAADGLCRASLASQRPCRLCRRWCSLLTRAVLGLVSSNAGVGVSRLDLVTVGERVLLRPTPGATMADVVRYEITPEQASRGQLLPDRDLIMLGAHWLAAGHESPALLELASLTPSDVNEARALSPRRRDPDVSPIPQG